MLTYLSLAVGSITFIMGPLLLFLSLRLLSGNDIKRRIDAFVVKETTKGTISLQTLSAQTRGLTGSLTNRVILPWVRAIGRFLGRLTPAGSIRELDRKLTIAGNPFNLEAREFYGIKMAFFLLGLACGFIVFIKMTSQYKLLFALSPVGLGYQLPRTWLNYRVRDRQNKVRKGLPDALDMLSVCASAGLGFDQAMQRVSEHWDTPTGAEFRHVITEMEMGLSRRDALRNMADRLDVTELSSFVAFILQAEQLGTSIVDILHAQSDQMRIERRFRAQEQALKIPTKMIIPMAFLILPAILAIILGPVIPPLFNLINFGH